MGYDAYVYIKKKYTKLSIEKLLMLQVMKKERILFIVAMMRSISFLQVFMFGCAMKMKMNGYTELEVKYLQQDMICKR